MKRWNVLFAGLFLISGLLLVSCDKKESAQEKAAKDKGVAVQTYDKAVNTISDYNKKNKEAVDQMKKEEAAGSGK
ncbi:MAG: hypothetical protein Q7U10_11415 [Thermodesulfovibrionia bacterium]|nr:hypothetical protein [Thermodesulfovibrionia bacterium]